tara:strand:- start:10073 stop:24973 length:14901 start_codon:yes stop_codon:yes gene_type:complete
MKLKDLYNSTKVIKSTSLEDMTADVESESYIEQTSIDERRFYPNVDFSDPAQFAIYGSAEKYYTDAFARIRTVYPYDGSESEKTQWTNESTFIDKYIFDHKYPRFNGYINLGYPSWGTLNGSLIDGYGKSSTNTFIRTFGGPNKSGLLGLEKQFGDGNKLDIVESRESNLKFNLNDGVTVEMWLKKPTFDTSKTEKEVLFDLWNGEASSSAQYGRLRLELTGASSGSPFLFTALSGASGVKGQTCGLNVTTGSITDWTHIALSLKNSGSSLSANMYVNGALNHQQSISSAALNDVTGSIISYIGALQTAPSGSPTVQTGAGKFSGSMDEFRYWKTERTSKEIGRYYWNTIGGGTNTDKANTKLGVYYKFNEGITQTSSLDSIVLDYSGRVSNGTWTGYVSGARSTDSAMVLAGVLDKEIKDPTIRSEHPEYISALSALEITGSNYDTLNNSSIFHTMPQWILEDDDGKEGNLRNLTQIMASYFDNMHLHIKEINHLKDVYSHFQTKTNDEYSNTSTSGSTKPLPFADRLLTNLNFVAPELFSDASVLEKLAMRSEDENYEIKLNDIKNQIYQNVYSGLTNTLKGKGTNKAFRNILHAFGIDEEVVKINFYGNNVEFELKDRYSIRAVKEKFIDFNNPDRFIGSLYQISSGSNISFITGSASEFEKFIPLTYETQIILPNKMPFDEPFGFSTPFTKSSIAGMHQVTSNSSYTIASPDNCDIQMYVERDERESKRVKFHLSSSALGVHLSSSLYEGMYDNNEWLLAFKLVNSKHPSANLVSSSSDGNYNLHFIGYNTIDSTELNSFALTSSVASSSAHSFLINSKRIYAGAKRTNFTGSIIDKTDIKLGFARLWYSELSNDTLKRHSYDSRNYGAESPFRSAYLMQTGANTPKVPEIETLILNWDFSTLSSTDSNGEAIVLDASSGSAEIKYNASFEAVKNKFYFGKLDFMPANDTKAIDAEYITAARSTYPEILQGDDMIEIRTQDDDVFTKETLPQEFYVAFEKSMAQTVSQEMINFMSSVTDFNNLIGRPVERYRMEYKAMAKLRQLFFERVSNEPDLDKYIDYYKWLDDALGEMLVSLVPASLAHSDGINNVIENHVFARDKYTNKFPTIEFKAPILEAGMNTINRHLYPWKTGHAPVGGTTQNKNCFWWLERAERARPPLSGSVSGTNNSRVKVFQARSSVLDRSYSTPQHFAVNRGRAIHGGINYEDNKKRDYIWSATKEAAESPAKYGEYGAFPLRYVITNNDMFSSLKDCTDERPVTEKIKRAFSALDGFQAFHHDLSGGHDGLFKGGMVLPFNIMSSSVSTGYTGEISGTLGAGNGSIDVTNVHSDTTDLTNEIPMQSPFTERWVGGHQSRHAPLNEGSDIQSTRGEGYKILINNIQNASGSIGIVGADYPYPYSNRASAPHFRIDQAKARYYRDERAKRPLNVKNIQTSGSIVGNYQKTYQFVHTSGRSINKTRFRDIGDTNLHNSINSKLPSTNLEASLVSRGAGSEGNLASNFNSSSLYLGGVKETTENSVAGTGKSVIVNRFSAPGGFETMSEVFLDMFGKEKSAYNAMPFRNLQVRGLGSGESGTIRITDIHGNRYGLATHLTRHASQFGIDSVLGGNNPAFHKVNRNSKWSASSGDKKHDNYWVQHQIPQSDFQYKWVKSSHTASLATSSLAEHILSDFSEPSGTTSTYPHENVNYIVVSQSVTNQRITGATVYGYPSWEQIRNNDSNRNVRNKKSYGYSIESSGISETLEESRITENIPMYTIMKFKGETFRFVYPYVNMKYHFDNTKFGDQGVNPEDNETMYDNVLGYYKNEDHESFSLKAIRVRQNLFPDFLKHTKYNTRHRHHFVSKFWTDGENLLYNRDTGPNSYFRLDEVGRRKTNVTASLFSEKSLTTLVKSLISDGTVTNIIPTQSVWNMDSRINFTSSSPRSAAIKSAGAPGVLQNQDHHFHNGISVFQTLISGTASTGSFDLKGATRFGTSASGSFTVQGMSPTGIAATGSFEITGANVQGTTATGEFTAAESFSPAVSSSFRFTSQERTVLGLQSTASFEVSGAIIEGIAASSSFTLNGLPVGGERSYLHFDASYEMAVDADAIYCNTSTIRGIEIDTQSPTSVSGTNLSVSPVTYKKAMEIEGSEYLSGSVSIVSEDLTLSFYLKIPDASLLSASKQKYIYALHSGSEPVLEIHYDVSGSGGTQNDLYVRRFGDNGGGGTGYLQSKFTNVGGDSKYRHYAVTSRGAAVNNLYIDGVAHTNVTSSTVDGGTAGGVYSTGTFHHIAGEPGKSSWDSKIAISDFIGWATTPGDGGDRLLFVEAVYNHGHFSPNTAVSASNIVFHYTFGDHASDGTSIGDNIIDINSTAGPYPLTQKSNLTNSSFVDSKFASMKDKTIYFNEITASLKSESAFDDYFDVNYVEFSETATGNISTQWYHTMSQDVAPRDGTNILTGSQIETGDTLNYARFYITAKAESSNSNYDLSPSSSTKFGGSQAKGFRNLDSINSGSAQANAMTSAEDTGITIDGTTISFDHHANSQGTPKVATFASTYERCLSGSVTSNPMGLSNTSYSGKGLTSSDDISISYWHAKGVSGTEGIFFLDATTGHSSLGALYVYHATSAINIRLYSASSSTAYKVWTVTYASLGINKEDLNHFCWTIDVSNVSSDSATTLYINGAAATLSATTAASFGAFSHTYTKLQVIGADGSASYELTGRLCQVSIWNTVLDSNDASEIYHDGRIKDLYRHEKTSNLMHWYKLGQETDITALSIGDSLTSISTIADASPRGTSVDLTVGYGSLLTVENGLPDNQINDASLQSNLESSIDSNVSDYNASHAGSAFTLVSIVTGTAANSNTHAEDSPLVSSLISPSAGGTLRVGSFDGDNIVIDTKTFELDDDGTANTTNNKYITINGVTNTQVWDELKAEIDASSSFTVTSTSSVGSVATFNLQANATGSSSNNEFAGTGASFNVTKDSEGGTNETGANDDDNMSFFAVSGQNADGFRVVIDKDNSNTGGLHYSASVDGGTGFTTIYVDSTRTSNTDFWNTIETAIEAEGFAVSQGSDNPRTFTVTNYTAAAAGNGGGSGNGNSSGGTFVKVDSKFATGSDASGAGLGDTVTISGTVFTITHVATSSAAQVQASGVSSAVFWDSLRTKINAQTGYTASTGSDSPRTFQLVSSATGSAQNPNISGDAGTFSIVSAGVAGTTESGAENGDTITIDGSTFAINIGGGMGTGSTSNFHNALSQSIKTSTDFDTIVITNLGTGYHRFSLTSSVTGTAKNVTFVQNTNGSRATFQNLAGAAGGTSPIGIQDLDHVKIRDEANSRDRYFAVDLNGDESNDTPTDYVYIDVSGYTGTDASKSSQFWNDLSASIKTNTAYDTISIVSGSNTATFSVTSSITGAIYNGDILQVYTGSNDGNDGFAIANQTAGGTDDSGSTSGDTITIDGTTFTIVHNSSPTALQINASGVTDNSFFNALTAAVEANTAMSATFTVTSNTGSFGLTSSITGTAKNVALNETGNSFNTLVGLGGGTNAVKRNVKFNDIIPQPRYNYPHALVSPGSLRAPTAKSNLGLISSDYKLRSNHFNLTRSLGHPTDGLYDNTSRWLTPSLSGLTPFDSDYDTWYENIRGHNKHFSLVPEFRISSHVKGIVSSESSEMEYFKSNYWLEITGTSADSGSTVNRNTINISGNEFLKEYSLSTNIKNMENFIEENDEEVKVVKLTLTCDAIMSFLPYDGFYPQSRTVQMCEAFASSYGKHFTAEEADADNTDLEFPDNNSLAQSRPIFDAVMSPGLLFNTIKSGMAVDYPIITSKLATASLSDPYGGKNYMVNNEYFDDRLPFETLINPEAHLANKRLVDTNPHISSSFNLRAEWNGLGDSNYKLMSNNFFAESIEFFLEGGKTSRIISKPDTDPDFGIVIANHAGILPIYRSIFKVYKSKKQHPWIEFSGIPQALKISGSNAIDENKRDKYYYRPPSGTNYFLREYGTLTGSNLEYDLESVGYSRPQMNPYAEVETITMYSQPNAFGPPCAGGVSVEFGQVSGSTPQGTGKNNTTYMMYDSTNGYNAPFTPPYYDGEAWALYTFAPKKAGKHTLSEILENTTVDFLRYELNHESGSYGDRGTFGPQGFSINENAMQIDASFNLFKQVSMYPAKYNRQGGISEVDTSEQIAGKAWVIESKYETPILDFSKYLNRKHNATFESDVTTSDIYTGSLSLSGTRSEPNVLGSIHSSLSSVHELSGILNPIGMWHQYGDFPESDDKGIFMQMIDVPSDYTILGTELTVANPKYTVVKPDVSDCDGSGLDLGYNKNALKTLVPYFKKQETRRKLIGNSGLSVLGSSIQLINKEDGIIIDAELNYNEMVSVYGNIQNAQSSSGLFSVFSSSVFTKEYLTTNSVFTGSTYQVFLNSTASSGSYPQKSSGTYQGNWATAYYNYDRANSYTPLLIEAKDYNSLSFDYDDYPRGIFEDFLKEFSIGIKYTDQSAELSDRAAISCVEVDGKKQIVPSELEDKLVQITPSIKSYSKIDMSEKERKDFFGLKGRDKKNTKKFKSLKGKGITKKFKLIPDSPAVESAPSAVLTSSYDYPEPTFIRASIRYNAGAATGLTFSQKVQMAPQNDKNFAGNASTVRWGQFMHNEGSPVSVKSLAELVGFSQEKIKMGVTAKIKKVREAVIAIPYIAVENDQREFLTLNKFEVDMYMFQNNIIPNDRNFTNFNNPLRIKSPIGQTVIEQIDKMRKYNLPPHLDFIENDIEPLPMYIFEFEKELDRTDLNAIWQGVRTEKMKKVEFKQEKISHDINVNEMLGGLLDEAGNGIESLKDVKWMIFKVKQKGSTNYNKKMANDLLDSRFGFTQQNTDDSLSNLNFGYNWPYDFFSMVENVKMSVDVTMSAQESDDSNANNSAGYKTTIPSSGTGIEPAVVGRRTGNTVPRQEYEPKLVTGNDKFVFRVIPDNDKGGGGIDGGGTTDTPTIDLTDSSNNMSDVQSAGGGNEGVDDEY